MEGARKFQYGVALLAGESQVNYFNDEKFSCRDDRLSNIVQPPFPQGNPHKESNQMQKLCGR